MFKLYDTVELIENVSNDVETIFASTQGRILDIYDDGEAYGVQFIKKQFVDEPYIIVESSKIKYVGEKDYKYNKNNVLK